MYSRTRAFLLCTGAVSLVVEFMKWLGIGNKGRSLLSERVRHRSNQEWLSV
jgi:hypothetical protein